MGREEEEKKTSKLPDPLIAVDPLFHQNSGVL